MYRIIGNIAIGAVLLWGYVKYLETQSIFYPAKKIQYTPASIRLPFEDIRLLTQDGLSLNGWFVPGKDALYTLLFLHGNAGNLGDRLEKIQILKNLGLNIFIIDYRGYGQSRGRPSEKGLYLDAHAAYGYLVHERKVAPGTIIVYGESLGTAVAVELASSFAVKAMVLEGAFSCGKDIAKRFFPVLPTFLFSDTYNSMTKIKKTHCALLLLHSKDDEVIPFALAGKLFAAAPGPKAFVELKGAHNDAVFISKDRYAAAIANFIEKL